MVSDNATSDSDFVTMDELIEMLEDAEREICEREEAIAAEHKEYVLRAVDRRETACYVEVSILDEVFPALLETEETRTQYRAIKTMFDCSGFINKYPYLLDDRLLPRTLTRDAIFQVERYITREKAVSAEDIVLEDVRKALEQNVRNESKEMHERYRAITTMSDCCGFINMYPSLLDDSLLPHLWKRGTVFEMARHIAREKAAGNVPAEDVVSRADFPRDSRNATANFINGYYQWCHGQRDYRGPAFDVKMNRKRQDEVLKAMEQARRDGVPQTQYAVLCVYHMPRETTEEQLYDAFRHFKNLTMVRLLSSNQPVPAQVAFFDEGSAGIALEKAQSLEIELVVGTKKYPLVLRPWIYDYVASSGTADATADVETGFSPSASQTRPHSDRLGTDVVYHRPRYRQRGRRYRRAERYPIV